MDHHGPNDSAAAESTMSFAARRTLNGFARPLLLTATAFAMSFSLVACAPAENQADGGNPAAQTEENSNQIEQAAPEVKEDPAPAPAFSVACSAAPEDFRAVATQAAQDQLKEIEPKLVDLGIDVDATEMVLDRVYYGDGYANAHFVVRFWDTEGARIVLCANRDGSKFVAESGIWSTSTKAGSFFGKVRRGQDGDDLNLNQLSVSIRSTGGERLEPTVDFEIPTSDGPTIDGMPTASPNSSSSGKPTLTQAKIESTIAQSDKVRKVLQEDCEKIGADLDQSTATVSRAYYLVDDDGKETYQLIFSMTYKDASGKAIDFDAANEARKNNASGKAVSDFVVTLLVEGDGSASVGFCDGLLSF